MILADKIVASAGGPFDEGGLFTALARNVRAAQRFVLSPEVAQAAHHVTQSRPSSISAAIQWCRLPYDQVWLEWGFSDVQAAGGYGAPVTRESTVVPTRVGALLQALSGPATAMATLCWDDTVSGMRMATTQKGVRAAKYLAAVSFTANIFDWRDEPDIHSLGVEPLMVPHRRPTEADLETRAQCKALGLGPRWSGFISSDPAERRAAIEAQARTMPIICPYMVALMGQKIPSRQELHDLVGRSFADWEGEALQIEAALILLNSRNLLSRGEVSHEKINRRRAARRNGKPQLLDYTHLDISLTAALERRAARAGLSHAEMRRHLVRGHFKCRRTGVYWWSPHVRGTLGQPATREYRVSP